MHGRNSFEALSEKKSVPEKRQPEVYRPAIVQDVNWADEDEDDEFFATFERKPEPEPESSSSSSEEEQPEQEQQDSNLAVAGKQRKPKKPAQPTMSKKERNAQKEKELLEMAAVLGELGVNSEDVLKDAEGSAATAKPKKKKQKNAELPKILKEPSSAQSSGAPSPATATPEPSPGPAPSAEEEKKTADPKVVLRQKLGPAKKKPQNPEIASALAEKKRASASKPKAKRDKLMYDR
eukprot:Polyplicarium_translucidae@DN1649_c0_g1_i1.p1